MLDAELPKDEVESTGETLRTGEGSPMLAVPKLRASCGRTE